MVYISKIPRVMRPGGGGVCKVMITLRDVLCFRCEFVTWVNHTCISYHIVKSSCRIKVVFGSTDHASAKTV